MTFHIYPLASYCLFSHFMVRFSYYRATRRSTLGQGPVLPAQQAAGGRTRMQLPGGGHPFHPLEQPLRGVHRAGRCRYGSVLPLRGSLCTFRTWLPPAAPRERKRPPLWRASQWRAAWSCLRTARVVGTTRTAHGGSTMMCSLSCTATP